MKKRILALVLVLLLVPATLAFAAEPGYADSLMEGLYAVIGGDQSITIRSHAETGGRGGYCQSLYRVELTGEESKAELDALAAELVESDAEPVWGGSKPCFHSGSVSVDPVYTMNAADWDPGCYLYVCYTFACKGGSYNHVPVPYYERISTMSIRVTEEARGLELRYALTDENGRDLTILTDGGEAQLDLNGGRVFLSLRSDVEHPVEVLASIDASSDAFTYDPATGELISVTCGSGVITVTIRTYLGETRTEELTVTVPCAPQSEPTVVIPNTCTEDGLAVYRCHGYGVSCETEFEEVVLPATGHILFSVSQYIEKPTATLPGIGMGTCQNCGMIGVEQELPPIFRDVEPENFYSRALDHCYHMGWVTGTTADTFSPNADCVRAQVVTFLWRAAGQPAPKTLENPFADVKESDFYYNAVLWALENGITTGTDATHFSPMGVCNRAQVVTFLWRTFGQPEPDSQDQPFTDVADGTWYSDSVLWAMEEGITSGMTPTAFGPTANCNRAQIVTFLFRAYAE